MWGAVTDGGTDVSGSVPAAPSAWMGLVAVLPAQDATSGSGRKLQ